MFEDGVQVDAVTTNKALGNGGMIFKAYQAGKMDQSKYTVGERIEELEQAEPEIRTKIERVRQSELNDPQNI